MANENIGQSWPRAKPGTATTRGLRGGVPGSRGSLRSPHKRTQLPELARLEIGLANPDVGPAPFTNADLCE